MIIVTSIIFFVLFPMGVKNFVDSYKPFNLEGPTNLTWIGFYAAFYGAIFGGVISGILTFLGVKLTISNQKNYDNVMQNKRRIMLYTQVKFTYDMISKINPGIENEYYLLEIIYDSKWPEQINSFDLSVNEYRNVVGWFYCLQHLEASSILNNKNGFLNTSRIFPYIDQAYTDIGPIIEKMFNQIRNY